MLRCPEKHIAERIDTAVSVGNPPINVTGPCFTQQKAFYKHVYAIQAADQRHQEGREKRRRWRQINLTRIGENEKREARGNEGCLRDQTVRDRSDSSFAQCAGEYVAKIVVPQFRLRRQKGVGGRQVIFQGKNDGNRDVFLPIAHGYSVPSFTFCRSSLLDERR